MVLMHVSVHGGCVLGPVKELISPSIKSLKEHGEGAYQCMT